MGPREAPHVQTEINERAWSGAGGRMARIYSRRDLDAAEAALLARHRGALSGRVLELGSGAGRVTGHLLAVAREVVGLDISPTMLAHARAAYPAATFTDGDMKDLSRFADGSFDAVVAAANVIDVFDLEDRQVALAEMRRVLAPGGLLAMSSHNLAHAPLVAGPWAVRRDSARHALADLARVPYRVLNHRRLRHLGHVADGYGVVNDVSHNFGLLHLYVSREHEAAELATHGLALIETLDLEGAIVAAGDPAQCSSSLLYVAEAVAAA